MKIGLYYPHLNAPGGYPRDASRLADELEAAGHRVQRLGSEGALLRAGRGLDVVHVLGVFLARNPLAGRLAALRGLPYVVSPLGQLQPGALTQRGPLTRLFLALAGRHFLAGARAIHCLSGAEERAVRALVPDARTFRATLGCYPEDMPAVLPAPRPVDALFFGRMDLVQKGLDLLMEAIAVAAHSHGAALHVTLAGRNVAGSHDAIRRLARVFRIDDHVTLVGEIPAAEKLALMRGAGVFVYPSRFDGPPRPIREALLLGRPVLVSEHANMSEELERRGWARRFRMDPEDLGAHLARIARGDRPGPVDAEAVREVLGWPRVAEAYLAGYRAALETA